MLARFVPAVALLLVAAVLAVASLAQPAGAGGTAWVASGLADEPPAESEPEEDACVRVATEAAAIAGVPGRGRVGETSAVSSRPGARVFRPPRGP